MAHTEKPVDGRRRVRRAAVIPARGDGRVRRDARGRGGGCGVQPPAAPRCGRNQDSNVPPRVSTECRAPPVYRAGAVASPPPNRDHPMPRKRHPSYTDDTATSLAIIRGSPGSRCMRCRATSQLPLPLPARSGWGGRRPGAGGAPGFWPSRPGARGALSSAGAADAARGAQRPAVRPPQQRAAAREQGRRTSARSRVVGAVVRRVGTVAVPAGRPAGPAAGGAGAHVAAARRVAAARPDRPGRRPGPGDAARRDVLVHRLPRSPGGLPGTRRTLGGFRPEPARSGTGHHW
jgi:hypothetical protein